MGNGRRQLLLGVAGLAVAPFCKPLVVLADVPEVAMPNALNSYFQTSYGLGYVVTRADLDYMYERVAAARG